MDPVLAVRLLTAAAFTTAFVGLSKDLTRHRPSLTQVAKRQYDTYYLLILVTTSMVLARVFSKLPFVWVELALLVVGVIAAVTSTWRLHEQETD